jgi:hypothetical protein
MAAYLQGNVPSGEIVETWEPELGFLTDHAYHYPPSGWLDRVVRARWLTPTEPPATYDPLADGRAGYLVVGRFGKYTGIYGPVIAGGRAERVVTIGEYDLYRLR